MHAFEVTRDIAASPSKVWTILTDADQLANGEFGIQRIDGKIRAGAHFKLWSEAAPDRAFALTVTDFVPSERMVWRSGMPFGLFSGMRKFTLVAGGRGTTFHMREEYSGLMIKLIWPSIPDLQPSFEMFGDTLSNRAGGRL